MIISVFLLHHDRELNVVFQWMFLSFAKWVLE